MSVALLVVGVGGIAAGVYLWRNAEKLAAKSATGRPWKGLSREEIEDAKQHYILLSRQGVMKPHAALKAYMSDVGAQYLDDQATDMVSDVFEAHRKHKAEQWDERFPEWGDTNPWRTTP